jgi:hypothetical protein
MSCGRPPHTLELARSHTRGQDERKILRRLVYRGCHSHAEVGLSPNE